MRGEEKDIMALLSRNVKHFLLAHEIEYAYKADELQDLKHDYEDWLKEKIEETLSRLSSLKDKKAPTSPPQAKEVFNNTIIAAYNELKNFSLDLGLSENAVDQFEMHKQDSLIHFKAFIDYYLYELDKGTTSYTKKYLGSILNSGYHFEKNGKQYSLGLFLSFYEAYARRIAGLSFIEYARDHNKGFLQKEDAKWIEQVLPYGNKVKVPEVKSCYFREMQKWFRGDISIIIDRLLITTIPEEFRAYRQKSSLIEKSKLRSGSCADTPEPPLEILNPPLIKEFFLIKNSTFLNILTF